MRYALGIAAVALLFVLPASAQDVNIDYAHEYDFSKVKTFQYVDAEDGLAPNELMHDRIVGAIQGRLTSVAGLRAVTESPDIVVTYHLSSRENTVYSTTAVGYGGYGGYWGGWRRYGGGMASATTTASTAFAAISSPAEAKTGTRPLHFARTAGSMSQIAASAAPLISPFSNRCAWLEPMMPTPTTPTRTCFMRSPL